ncbi:hypothetical protein [Clostridium sp. KNHs205]|uniref:hypothetical protein n=1 Tax=Clostridium sp. KNHs205 TaxID=1449050 RepID=UPI0012DF8F8F|nr:hypothetical protein [Clostridium sp. KNHs205]
MAADDDLEFCLSVMLFVLPNSTKVPVTVPGRSSSAKLAVYTSVVPGYRAQTVALLLLVTVSAT